MKVLTVGSPLITFHHSRGNLRSEFLQLVSRRHQVFTTSQTLSHLEVTKLHLLTLEDMLKLQEDVVSLYLSGKPKIENIASIHIPFAFRAPKCTEDRLLK